MTFTDRETLRTPQSAFLDRRVHPRCTVQIPIDIRKEDNATSARHETIDLSRGGCYVQLVETLPLATYVWMTLWLDKEAVRVRGRVTTRHPRFGNGIMFLEFDGCGKKLLAGYLETVAV
jgi:hypothetical protein